MTDSEKVIKQAESWLGLNEADGSFKKVIDVYNEIGNGVPMLYEWPWCACFVSAVFYKAINETRFAEISCDRMIHLLGNLGWYARSASPKAGDVIFYNWDGDGITDHVGIVAEVDGENIKVIEGNKSDSVCYREITKNYPYIVGFGIIPYTGLNSDGDDTEGVNVHDSEKDARYRPDLSFGAFGDYVAEAQAILVRKGYLNKGDNNYKNVDGDFGVLTKAATMSIQSAAGIRITGIIDAQTWEVIIS